MWCADKGHMDVMIVSISCVCIPHATMTERLQKVPVQK